MNPRTRSFVWPAIANLLFIVFKQANKSNKSHSAASYLQSNKNGTFLIKGLQLQTKAQAVIIFVRIIFCHKYHSNQSDKEAMKGKKIMNIIRIINCLTAGLLIVLSVLSLAYTLVAAITSLKIFLIFAPFFMIGFGICILAAEFNVKWVLKNLPFLKSLIGKGLFNIYFSSVLYYYLDSADLGLLAWIGATSLFVSGFVYIGLHLGCGGKIKKEKEKQSRNDSDDNFREPLM